MPVSCRQELFHCDDDGDDNNDEENVQVDNNTEGKQQPRTTHTFGSLPTVPVKVCHVEYIRFTHCISCLKF